MTFIMADRTIVSFKGENGKVAPKPLLPNWKTNTKPVLSLGSKRVVLVSQGSWCLRRFPGRELRKIY
ncbi:hypothetical protein XENTR_v10007831 [Xenopus tropicalis]|nr:hypothetical protein XENTR_v10007831 [Xenopus tropicalis]